MTNEPPLLLPPPPPRFPTRFSELDNSPVLQPTAAPWPDSNGKERVDGPEMARVDVEWQLKTDSEEHIQRLESKLREVTRRERLDAASYGTSALSPHDSEAYNGLLASLDEDREEGLTALDGEHDGLVGGDAAEEGTALLSSTEAQSKTDEDERLSGWEDAPNDPDAPAEEGEADLSDLDGPSHLSFGHPATAAENAQRISFSKSVRISGGIRSSSRSCRKHRPIGDVFPGPGATERSHLLSAQPRVSASPSPLLVASVTSSSSPSRSVSPAGRGSSQPHLLAPRPRRPSSSSSYLSSSYPYPASYSGSPGSHIPSRSSSPCSSIYAPLQPPSKHCPNPIWVRPAAAKLQRQASATGLSFPEYLRNGYGAVVDDDDEEEDSDDDDPPAPRYAELVQQQRRKKARWEERKRQRLVETQKRRVGQGGFWDKLAGMLALGMVGVGAGRGGGAFGTADMVHTSLPRRPRSISSSPNRSRSRGIANGASSGPAASRPKSILSTSSSVSSASNSDGDGEPPVPSPRRRPPPPPPPPRDKTEADVRFGPAPWRYLRLDWLVSTLHHIVDAVKRVFATASAGVAKQRERDEARARTRTGGYHAV